MQRLAIAGLLVVGLLAALPGSALADCRTQIGGVYVFPHSGVKANGNPFSALAHFVVSRDAGTFDVHATINERNVGVYRVDFFGRPFGWTDGCFLWWDRPGFVGVVSSDGGTISFATFDAEQMAGPAFRISP